MSVVIFVLLSSQDGFSREWVEDDQGHRHAPAIYNGAFSTIAFLLGAVTSIASGFFGMKIAVYANARTALEARKGIAPAFMCGRSSVLFSEGSAAAAAQFLFCIRDLLLTLLFMTLIWLMAM